MSIKSGHWSYESEWRLIVELSDTVGIGTLDSRGMPINLVLVPNDAVVGVKGVGLYWVHQLIPTRAGQGAASHPAGEDVLLADPELLEHVVLSFRAPRGIVGLADPGVTVGDGDHEVILAQGPLCDLASVA